MLADQLLILLLMLDALIVAVGLAKKKNMWTFIVMYWIILFTKNAMNFTSTL
jgi:hypothetical protein